LNISLNWFEALTQVQVGCIAVGVYEDGELTPEAAALDAAGLLQAAVDAKDMTGKVGSSLMLRSVTGTGTERVLLVGLGPRVALTETAFLKAVRETLRWSTRFAAAEMVLALPLNNVAERSLDWAVHHATAAAIESTYRRDRLKSTREQEPGGIDHLILHTRPAETTLDTLRQAMASGHGTLLARELADLPPNICTPAYLADRARSLAADYDFAVDILGREELAALHMHSYLAVADGSALEPALCVLRHNGGAAGEAPIVLVGKGLTFDSGGISIKPSAAMDEMKYDMAGAAAVLGVFRTIGTAGLALNVIGIVAACENMPSGASVRPGDIVTSMKGLTIEVLNTDAEGRLVLCDALTYAERFQPAVVLDIATLTGACVVALGTHHSGVFTRHQAQHLELAARLVDAGDEAGDPAWRMPVEPSHGEQLKSEFADIANIGSPGAGASVAAAFLERFTRDYVWAHLDIAGTAWKSGGDKGATGRPVPLLARYLFNLADSRQQESL